MAFVLGTMVQWLGSALCRPVSVGSFRAVVGSRRLPKVLLRRHMIVGDFVASQRGNAFMTSYRVLMRWTSNDARLLVVNSAGKVVVHFSSSDTCCE